MIPRWLLVALFAKPKRRYRGHVMFDHPPYGTDCARCPKSYINGESRSLHPASTRCQWCESFLCSLHAEAPFESSRVRACTDCAARVYAAQKAIVIDGKPVTFLAAAPASWAAKYGSDVFTGYAPGAR